MQRTQITPPGVVVHVHARAHVHDPLVDEVVPHVDDLLREHLLDDEVSHEVRKDPGHVHDLLEIERIDDKQTNAQTNKLTNKQLNKQNK